MNLEFQFTLLVTTQAPLDIGEGPFGIRKYFEVTGGTIEGTKLKGKVSTGGGDWSLIGTDGFARLDVRAQLLTHDGAAIYMFYPGLLEYTEKVEQALATGGSTDYADHYLRTTPRFETGDARYGWLNQSIYVAEGRLQVGVLEYRIYRVA